jgi:hypothetical protein
MKVAFSLNHCCANQQIINYSSRMMKQFVGEKIGVESSPIYNLKHILISQNYYTMMEQFVREKIGVESSPIYIHIGGLSRCQTLFWSSLFNLFRPLLPHNEMKAMSPGLPFLRKE